MDALKTISGTTVHSTQRLANVVVPGIEATPDKIGEALVVLSGVGVAAHLTSVVARKQINKFKSQEPDEPAADAGEKE